MSNIISELVSLEGTANSILAPALEAQKNLSDKIAAETEIIKIRITDDAAKIISNFEQSSAVATKKAAELLNAENQRKCAELEASFRQNKDKWVEAAVKRIITVSV